MSAADLNKRFINTFLYLMGKLYTQIDTEDFPVAQVADFLPNLDFVAKLIRTWLLAGISAGPVPRADLAVAAAALHRPPRPDHGAQHVHHRGDRAQVNVR
jgi:hypothetical protein